ncbi:MAG: hypothetical protein ACRD4R_00455 [Candidatus Acidiferrales bacterium]
MPQTDKQNNEKQNKGDRRRPMVILSVVAIILVGVFLIILFFFHTDLHSKAFFRPGTISSSQIASRARASARR